MTRYVLALATIVVSAVAVHAGPFSRGIGSAMIYGPYTGGHGYSYNVAYSYGFAFSSADTWRRDLFAYPAGVYPYRPYGQPILHRAWPKNPTPPISVPGEDGLPVLAHPGIIDGAGVPGAVIVPTVPQLQPVPGQGTTVGDRPALIHVRAPQHAEVWIEKEKAPPTSGERVYETPPLPTSTTRIYTVRAKWNEGGRDIEQFRVVGIKGGESARVTFEP